MQRRQLLFLIVLSVISAFLLTGCTAGDPQYTAQNPANFWHGLWHGMISVIAFVISLFRDGVGLYEVHNNGGWYNFGFLLGITCIWGGGSGAAQKSRRRKHRDHEWSQIGDKLERKILHELKAWVEEEQEQSEEEHQEHAKDREEWKEIEEKVTKKLKRKLKEWAEEED